VVLAVTAASLLAGCSFGRRGTPDTEPTLKVLAGRSVAVEKDAVVAASEEQAIEAYTKFLAITAKTPKAPERAEAMRRIGDLEMERAEVKSAADPAASAPDYRLAVARYQEFLKTYPKDPANDRVLYQLSRAYEQGGDLDTALKTLDRLVADYPATSYRDEAQFRRGELLFRRATMPVPRRRMRRCSPRAPPIRTTTAPSTCRVGRPSSRVASTTASPRSSASSTSSSPAATARAASRRCRA